MNLLYTSPSQDFVLHLFVCLSLPYLLLVLRISPTLKQKSYKKVVNEKAKTERQQPCICTCLHEAQGL